MKSLFSKKHTCLIVGSNGVIGSKCIDSLSKIGLNIFSLDKYPPKKQKKNIKFILCDITKIDDVIKASKKIKNLDSIIFTAGINYDDYLINTNWKKYDELMSVNLKGAFHIGSIFGKHLKSKKSGSFVFISSTAALTGEAGATVYSASKGGLISFVESFAAEMTDYNVRVNAICPGNIKSPMLKDVSKMISKRINKSSSEIYNEMKVSGAAKKLVEVEDVVNLIIFLISDNSKSITGSSIKIDNGATLYK